VLCFVNLLIALLLCTVACHAAENILDIQKLGQQWTRCVEKRGDYVGKLCTCESYIIVYFFFLSISVSSQCAGSEVK
jgi:hypothetical protein